ncbi:TIGR03621 family F420-dependent LLM class oxidoreductase [Nocardia macrotermitis]|uniref:F420-dependent glucose-6-phosphate dehydrogenase n=1 Tax=Nocardia macrotermitis TaxID=2585198 RepID=A0A7K0CU78_9NOCA|nr:TIGR03621 family F420-dependent LLM class oxidoreductase [Nocardia macrotermitis]MQY17029.1 F420-dependent glucose-6-phosphate dehydrogenase [Nocardia macrotermitis]
MDDNRNDLTPRPFRFAVGITATSTRSEWQDRARKAEDLGFDVVQVADHLGMVSPFPALITMAEATSRVRVGTMVLNSGFYRPALLARDVASMGLLTDGRFDFGIGAGPDFAKPEFEVAGLPFPGGRQRIENLAQTLTEIRKLFAGDHQPPVPHPIPVLVAGAGDRLIRVAAEYADTVAIAGVPVAADIDSDATGVDALARRVEFVRAAAGARFPDLELGLTVQGIEIPGHESDLHMVRMFNPALTEEQYRYLPGVLHGTARDVADTLRRYRDEYSVTHYSVSESRMAALADVIAELR